MKVIVLFLSTVVVLSSGSPPEDCVPPYLSRTCRQNKCAGSPYLENCENVVSDYPGGNQCCNERTANALKKSRSKRQFYNFDVNLSAKWNLPITYYLNFSQSTFETVIRTALNRIEASTCISFVQSFSQPSQQQPYIVFNRFSDGCVSFVGKSDKPASPIFGDDTCFSRFGTILYLVIQTLGMWHQTQRPDSSNYITVVRDNMDQSHWADFTPISAEYVVTLGLPFDYASITHYAGKVFSINGQPTLRTADPLYQNTIGQKVELSFQDAKLLNNFYCSASCSSSLQCLNGGYTNPKNCTQCVCPIGFQGVFCELFIALTKTSIIPNDCGGELTASYNNQYVSSPGYSFFQNSPITECVWKITAPNNDNITLKFTDGFGVFSDDFDACQHWVEIRYKPPFNATGPRFCGQTLPSITLNSTTSQVLVIYKSNDVGATVPLQRGFQLSFKRASLENKFCDLMPCMNGGTCLPTDSGYRCVCPLNYVGDVCQFDVNNSSNPCQGNPCRNNGTCQIIGSTFICVCMTGFYGNQCEHANCGGCDTLPGSTCDKKCIPPWVNCTNSRYGKHHSWKKFFSYNACNDKDGICCDNAVEVNSRCAALGWTPWSRCSQRCGPGQQYRYRYAMDNGVYQIVETQQNPCNLGACGTRLPFSRRWC